MDTARTRAHADRCVLFVDDVPSARRLFNLSFKDSFDVVCAADAFEALEVLASRPVGVLVTDHYMPGMTGVELCREVAERWPSVHRVIVTAAHDAGLVASALRQGRAHGVTFKPWSEELLRGRLRAALKGPRAAPEEGDAPRLGGHLQGLSIARADALLNSSTAARLALEVAEGELATLLSGLAASEGPLSRCFRVMESALERVEAIVHEVRADRRRRGGPRWGSPIGFHDVETLLVEAGRRLRIELAVTIDRSLQEAPHVLGQRALLGLSVSYALLRADEGGGGTSGVCAAVSADAEGVRVEIRSAGRVCPPRRGTTRAVAWRSALQELAALSGCVATECAPPRTDGTVLLLPRAPTPVTLHRGVTLH